MSRAAVRADGELVAEMGAGLLVLVGVASADDAGDAAHLADKLVHLRIFPDEHGRMNLSLLESGGTLGIVSQFTLLGDARRGRRPSYAAAARPEDAAPLLEAVIAAAREAGAQVVAGRFGATMELELVNTGPATILLDTRPPA